MNTVETIYNLPGRRNNYSVYNIVEILPFLYTFHFVDKEYSMHWNKYEVS